MPSISQDYILKFEWFKVKGVRMIWYNTAEYWITKYVLLLLDISSGRSAKKVNF